MVAESAKPSPFGEIVSGETASAVRSAAGGFGGGGFGGGGFGGGGLPLIVPLAWRTAGPASIVHVYRAHAACDESQRQAIACPDPAPVAAAVPHGPRTVTVHGWGEDRRPENRIAPPSGP